MMQPVGFQQVGWRQVGWQWSGMRRAQRNDLPNMVALKWPCELSPDGVLHSAVGPAPTFTGTPTVDSDGVTPGDGPVFSSVVTWADGGTRVWEIHMSTASADIMGDVEVGGGLSVNSSGLKFSDGTNTIPWSTSWAAAELVTAIVSVMDDGVRTLMRVVRGEDV